MGMDMNEDERLDLATRLREVRLARYKGSRKAAYTAAEVNSTTWTRAENGGTLAERSLVAIISAMWPETHGDWRRLSPPLGAVADEHESDELLEQLRQSVLSPEAKFEVERMIREDLARQASEGARHA